MVHIFRPTPPVVDTPLAQAVDEARAQAEEASRLRNPRGIITLLAAMVGLGAAVAEATVREAASCAPADVQTAVDRAASDDTVLLPACDAQPWDRTVVVTKPLTIRGRGLHHTRLQRLPGAPLLMFSVGPGKPGRVVSGLFTMSHLSLVGTYGTYPNVYQDLGVNIRDVTDFRVHDMAFSGLSRGVEIRGDPAKIKGVIDQNTFKDMYYRIATGALGYGVVVYGNGTWLPLELGTAQNVFVEDNVFIRNRHAIASNDGSRYVFRHNLVVDNREDASAIDAHGQGPWWPRGSRQYEIYGNTVINSVPRFAGVGLRGGDGVVFDNVFSANVTFEVMLTNEGGCTRPYPIADQIRELHIWGNTLNHEEGPPAPVFVWGTGCGHVIRENRDYFIHPRHGYEPYDYPHPARKQRALTAAHADDRAEACHKLETFIHRVRALTGEAIAVDTGGALLAAAAQVQAGFDCKSRPRRTMRRED